MKGKEQKQKNKWGVKTIDEYIWESTMYEEPMEAGETA